MTRTTLSRKRFSLPPITTGRGFITYAIAAGLIGSIVSLGYTISQPSSDSVGPAAVTHNSSGIEPLTNFEGVPHLSPETNVASQKNPALSATVDTASTGIAQSYTADGQLIDVEGVNPEKSQAEQGLDDKSGYTFPCVFVPGDLEVCQRKLTATEAAKTGF